MSLGPGTQSLGLDLGLGHLSLDNRCGCWQWHCTAITGSLCVLWCCTPCGARLVTGSSPTHGWCVRMPTQRAISLG